MNESLAQTKPDPKPTPTQTPTVNCNPTVSGPQQTKSYSDCFSECMNLFKMICSSLHGQPKWEWEKKLFRFLNKLNRKIMSRILEDITKCIKLEEIPDNILEKIMDLLPRSIPIFWKNHIIHRIQMRIQICIQMHWYLKLRKVI